MDERAETLQALAWHRHVEFANLVVLVLGIAAETHPEEIRRALSSVFDLSAYEDAAKRLALVFAEIQAQAQETRHLLQAVNQDIDRIEKRMDALNYELERRRKHA